MNSFGRFVRISLTALVLSAFSWSAHADYTWDLSYLLPGATGDFGTAATVALTQGTDGVDVSVTNGVDLTEDPNGAFLTRLWLSYTGTGFAGIGNINPTDPSVGPEGWSTGPGPAGYNGLNLEIDFSTNPPRFYAAGVTVGSSTGPGTVTFTLLGTTLADFGSMISSINGPDTPVMVMLQDGQQSFHYVVPEPNTYLLMFLGLGLMGLVIRRKLV